MKAPSAAPARVARGQPRRPGWLGGRLRRGPPTSSSASRCGSVRHRRVRPPRGAALRSPSTASTTREIDAFLGQDPTPDDEAEAQEFAALRQGVRAGVQQRTGALLGHVSTVDAAKDMDILRSALGDEKLNYLGKSYGTFLGATYADLFPKLVGRFVLDGVLPPDLTLDRGRPGAGGGFRARDPRLCRGLRRRAATARSATRSTRCMSAAARPAHQLDQQPIPMRRRHAHQLTEGWALARDRRRRCTTRDRGAR